MWKSRNNIFTLDYIKYKAFPPKFGTPDISQKTMARVGGSPVGPVDGAKNLHLEHVSAPGSLQDILGPHLIKFKDLPSKYSDSISDAFEKKYKQQISSENLKYWRLHFLEKTINNLLKEYKKEQTKEQRETTKAYLRVIAFPEKSDKYDETETLLRTIAVENCIRGQTVPSQQRFRKLFEGKKNDNEFFKQKFNESLEHVLAKNREFDTLKKKFSNRIHKVGEKIVRENFLRGSGKLREKLLQTVLLKEEVREKLNVASKSTEASNETFDIDDDKFNSIFQELYEKGIEHQTEISYDIVDEIAKRKHIEKISFYLDKILSQNDWLDLTSKYANKKYIEYSEEISNFADHETAIRNCVEDIYSNSEEINYGDIILKVITKLRTIGGNKIKIQMLDEKEIEKKIENILDKEEIKEIEKPKGIIIEKLKEMENAQLKYIIESHPIL